MKQLARSTGRSTRQLLLVLLGAATTALLVHAIAQRCSNPEHIAVKTAVAGAAGVHGFVTKAGPLDPQWWHHAYAELRQNRTRHWLAQREAALQAGTPVPPLQHLTTCQVWVSRRYPLIWVRHAKTGSASLSRFLNDSMPGNRHKHQELRRHKYDSSHLADSPKLDLVSLDTLSMTAEELADLWMRSLVVTFVRNPFQRALSAYRMMMRFITPATGKTYGGWDTYCSDPAGLADFCMRDADCAATWGVSGIHEHVNPQADCLLTGDGGWAVDFVGHSDTIDADLATVLEELDTRRPANTPPVRRPKKQLWNISITPCQEKQRAEHYLPREQYCTWRNDVQQSAYFAGRHAACYSAVQRLYSRDLETLQFPNTQLHA